MKIALCIFGQGSHNPVDYGNTIDQFQKKFTDVTIDFFTANDSLNDCENLKIVAWNKRQAEIKNNVQYQVTVGLNINFTHRLRSLTTLKVDEGYLYFTDGKHILADGKYNDRTCIDLTCFYGTSLVFDRAAEFHNWPPRDFLKTTGEQFYWYLKTWKIKTSCVDVNSFIGHHLK